MHKIWFLLYQHIERTHWKWRQCISPNCCCVSTKLHPRRSTTMRPSKIFDVSGLYVLSWIQVYKAFNAVISVWKGATFLFDSHHIITIAEKPLIFYFLIEVSVLLGCGELLLSSWCLMFWDNLVAMSSGVKVSKKNSCWAITKWCSATSQKNRDLNYTAAKA
jgi:hypothetical protein